MGWLSDISERGGHKSYHYRDMGKLWRTLDFIQRPSYLVQNLLEEIQDPERRTAKEILAPVNPFYKSRKGLWQLPEEVKGRGRDLWEDVEGMPEWGKTVAGLGTEVLTDPTTWLGFGAATKGAKALRAAGEFSKLGRLGQAAAGGRAAVTWRIPGLMKDPLVLARGLPYFKAEARMMKALNPLLKYVSKSAYLDSLPEGVKVAKEAAEQFAESRGKEMAGSLGELGGVLKRAKKLGAPDDLMTRIAETTGVNRIDDARQILREVAPKLPDDIAEQVVTKYDDFTKMREAFFNEADVFLSKYAPEEAEAISEMWVRHIATDDGLKYFGKIAKGKNLTPKLQQLRDYIFGWAATPEGVAKVAYQKTAMPIGQAAERLTPISYDQLFRKIARGQGIYEINAMAKSLGLKPIFQDDLMKVARTVMGDTMKVTKKGAYLQSLAKIAEDSKLATSDAEEALAKRWVSFAERYPDVLKRTTGATKETLSKLYFDPKHLDEVAHVVRQYSDPKQIQAFLKHYDNVLGVWKAWTLGPFIPYHVRNDFSDIVWFNWLAGVGTENYPDAIKVMRELAKRGDYDPKMLHSLNAMPFSGSANVIGRVKQAVLGGGIDDATAAKIADRIQAMDLLHKGQHIEAGGLKGKFLKPLKVSKAVEIGGIREDFGRIAHALDRLKKGWADPEVYADVMKYHYNYSIDALTPFERFLPNRMFFFYRWTRMNIPGSVRNLFEHWGKHVTTAKGLSAIEQGLPTWQEKYMPGWMKESGAVQVPEWVPLLGGKKAEPKYFMTEAWWPFAEVPSTLGALSSLRDTGREIGQRLAPPFKIPTEMITGQEIYYDKPIELYEGQRKKLGGVNVPANVAYLARQFRLVTEVDRMMKRWDRAEGADEKTKAVIRNALLGAKSYSFSPEREASQRFFETIKAMGIVKSELKKAEREGDYRLSRHLTDLLEKLGQQQTEYRTAAGI